jgi:curved DNA-binding protein CbpA
MGTKNYYQTLGVSPNSTDTEIKKAYRKQGKGLHVHEKA